MSNEPKTRLLYSTLKEMYNFLEDLRKALVFNDVGYFEVLADSNGDADLSRYLRYLIALKDLYSVCHECGVTICLDEPAFYDEETEYVSCIKCGK